MRKDNGETDDHWIRSLHNKVDIYAGRGLYRGANVGNDLVLGHGAKLISKGKLGISGEPKETKS